jgi:glycosyltransferase involved in cell wall biosynthesis
MTEPSTTLPISVVIPAYQAETFLPRALGGVAQQTRRPAEVIVVDDGSTDATAAVAERFGARVVRQANRGASAARNTGIREARFPWVALLDADDRWFPAKLETQWAAHERYPEANLVLSDYQFVDEAGHDLDSAFTRLPHYAKAKRFAIDEQTALFERGEFARTVAHTNVVSSSTLLLKRDWLLINGLWYAENLPNDDSFAVAEDFEWLLRALRHTDVVVVERALADYLQRSESRSARRGRQAAGDIVLGDLIAKSPDAYAEGMVEAFERRRPAHERRAALEYLRERNYTAAAATAARLLRGRPDPFAAGLFALATAARWSPAARALERVREYRLARKAGPAPAVPEEDTAALAVPTLPISVVIPAYNVAAYLDIALASVHAQSLQPAEIIVVDDGSTDATRALAERAGVRVLAQANAGAAAARNAGVAAAVSPWIAFLDADDRWLPDKLERQWAALEAAPEARVLATDTSLHFEAGGGVEPSGHAIHRSYGSTAKTQLAPDFVRLERESLAQMLPRGQFLAPSTWLVRRDLLLEQPFDQGLQSDAHYAVPEDFEWLLRVFQKVDAFVLEAPLTEYVVRAQGSSSERTGRLRFGDVKLGELVGSMPERYLAGTALTFRSLRREQERIAVTAFLRAGDAAGAEAVLDSIPTARRSFEWLGFRAAALGLRNPLGEKTWRQARAFRRSLARS